MSTTTIRIRRPIHDALKTLSDESGESMQAVLEKAIESYRRQRFLEAVNEAYATLRENEPEWLDYQAEFAAWDVTLADGLEDLEETEGFALHALATEDP